MAAWDPLPDEPKIWYARFDVFRMLGVHRTLEEAFRQAKEAEGLTGERPGQAWYTVAREWDWEGRTAAWDAAQRAEFRARHANEIFDAHAQRATMIDQLLVAVFRLLAAANLADLTQEEARQWVPVARLLFKDLLQAQHRELGLPDFSEGDEQGRRTYSADELRQLQTAYDAWRQAHGNDQQTSQAVAAAALSTAKAAADLAANCAAQSGAQPASPPGAQPGKAQPGKRDHAGKRTLLVCVGRDSALMVDLATLRAVKDASGLSFHRICDVTRANLDAYLRRQRKQGQPVELLHLAVHASTAGAEFADGFVDGQWLSQRLLGVRVMLLGGCRDDLGDWAGVVPYVVTLSEEMPSEDAATLAQAFWTAIGRHRSPETALAEAVSRCSPAVAGQVASHWEEEGENCQ